MFRKHLFYFGILISLLLPSLSSAAKGDGADGEFDRRRSSHFVLFQDVAIDQRSGWYGSIQFERDVLEVLESAYDRLDHFTGLRPRKPITVMVYDPLIYDESFAAYFRFRSAGFYEGIIRIRGGAQVNFELKQVLHHEFVHAAVDQAAPRYRPPAWFNEGLAEWFANRTFGKRALASWEWQTLVQARQQGSLIPIASMATASFGYLGQDQASLAYLEAYGILNYLASKHGERRIERFVSVTLEKRDVEQGLRKAYGIDLEKLEAGFVGHLR